MNPEIMLAAVLLATAVAAVCDAGDEPSDSALSDRDKEILVALARQTLQWHVLEKKAPSPDPKTMPKSVLEKLGCFVTLDKKVTGLRGCIGIFERKDPLYKNVISRTIAAASQDPRFPAVKPDELKDIKLEISVLTAPSPLTFDSPKDLLAKLRPLIHGVILETPYGGSTYLPQVWEQIPDKEDFLSHLCRKHGAPMDFWRRDPKRLRVLVYEAIVLGEEDFGRKVVGSKGGAVGEGGAVLVGFPGPFPKGLSPGDKLEAGTALVPGMILTADSHIAGN